MVRARSRALLRGLCAMASRCGPAARARLDPRIHAMDLLSASITDSAVSCGSACGMKARRRARSRAGMPTSSSRPKRIDPRACTTPAMARSSVDLPAAFGPTSAVTRPSGSGPQVRPRSRKR